MSHNITVEGGTSVRLPTAGKYCDRDILITGTGGSENLDSVLTEQETLITELKALLKSKASSGSTNAPLALVRRGLGCIDTGINGANSNLTIEARYEFETMPTGYWYLIRAYVNESTNATRILYNKTTATYCCLNSPATASLSVTQTRYPGVVYTDVLQPASSTSFSYTTNGVKTTKARASGEALVGKNLLIFNDTTSDDGVSVKLYHVKIYDGDTLVRDYVPYVSVSGECGLYDKVTKQFHGNFGSGTFEVEMLATEDDYKDALREMGVEV